VCEFLAKLLTIAAVSFGGRLRLGRRRQAGIAQRGEQQLCVLPTGVQFLHPAPPQLGASRKQLRMKTGPIRHRAIYEKLRALKIGEEITIARSEWRARTPPTSALVYARNHRGKFVVRKLVDRAGWLVVRASE